MSYYRADTLGEMANFIREQRKEVCVKVGEIILPVDRELLLNLWDHCRDSAEDIEVYVGHMLWIESRD
jgi:hypothetical protein